MNNSAAADVERLHDQLTTQGGMNKECESRESLASSTTGNEKGYFLMRCAAGVVAERLSQPVCCKVLHHHRPTTKWNRNGAAAEPLAS